MMKKISIFLNILIVVNLFGGLVPKAEAAYGYISVSQSYFDGNSGSGTYSVDVSWNSGGFDAVSGAVVYVSLNNSGEKLFSYKNSCNNCRVDWIQAAQTTQVYEFRLYEYNSFTGWVGNLLSKATVTVSPRVSEQQPTPQPQPQPGRTYYPYLSINKTNFVTTDTWYLNLTSAPENQQVYICAIDNRGVQSCTPVENLGLKQTTDSNGNWSASGNWNGDESIIGNWTEWVYVGGTLQNGQVTGGVRSNNINFTISRPQSTCNGYPTLVITPPSATINVSQTQNFRALYDPDGPSCPQAEQDKTSEVSWNSSNSNVASLVGAGSFTGRSAGSATITATFSGITAWATLNVYQPQQNYYPYLSINKTNFVTTDTWNLNLTSAPPNQQVYICAIDNRGVQSCTPVQNLGLRQTTDRNGNWSASGNWNGDESVVGTWTEWVYVGGTLQNGQVTGGVRSNNITFTVSRPQQTCQGYKTLVITPPSATINVSQTQNFRALYDPDGPSCPQAEQDKTSEVSWNSSNSNVAFSNGNGSFTGRSAGSATITATFSGITAWATLNVNQTQQNYYPYLSINKTNFVTTDTWNLNLTSAPPNQQVYICAIDNRGVQSCTPVQNLGLRQTTDRNGNWSASGNWNGDESVVGTWTEWVYVGGTLQNGQVTGGVRSNNITFTVSRPQQTCQGYKTLVITPPSATINVSQTQNFRALYDPDGPSCPQAEQDKTSEVSWNSSNSNVAFSNGNGSFTGRSAGSATITATFSGITAWATLNVYGSNNNPSPSGSVPQVTTLSATSITQNSAVLNGAVNPNNAATQYRFEYGQTPSLGNYTSWQSAGSGNNSINVYQSISGLSPNTTYYFRIVAQNSYGQTQGQILSFVTQNNNQNIGGAPLATTQPATNITQNSARLNAVIDPNNNLTYYRFEYGTSPSSLVNYTGFNTISGSISNTPVSANIFGLQQNTTYYFRIYAYNNAGESRGQILSFNTSGDINIGSQPQVTTLSATSITQNSAVLNGAVNPNNAATQYRFEYGQTPSLGNYTSWQSAGSGNNSINVYQSISGLSPNTTYYFRIVAQNSYGQTQGQILSFVTQNNNQNIGGAPLATTQPATNITQNSARLNAVIDPNNNLTYYRFEYGTSPSSLVNYTGFNTISGSISNTPVSADIFGLQQNTTYYFRIYAYNNAGESRGQILSFNTSGDINIGSQPQVTTLSATSITQNSAVLNGAVNPNNAATQYRFEYGQTPSLGNYTSWQSAGSGNTSMNVYQSISGLSPNTTYYFRIVAQNSYGQTQGQILSFVTDNLNQGRSPDAFTDPASGISYNSAVLNGRVNPNGDYTSYYFEYGTNSSFGYTTGFQSAGSGNGQIFVSSYVSGLNPNTTYYFRIVAQNSYGRSYGSTYTFTTNSYGGWFNPIGSAPYVTTYSATNIYDTNATLNAQINPNNSDTQAWFEYGTSQNYLSYTTSYSSIGRGNYNSNFNQTVYNLLPNTTYYFRAVARNQYGISYGQILSFSTGSGSNYQTGNRPIVRTIPASYISTNSALLNGEVNPNGGLTSAWIEYGPNVSLGLRTTVLPMGSGNQNLPYAFAATGLLPNTIYYFRIVAQNQYGTSYGQILSFQTQAAGVTYTYTPPPPTQVITSPTIQATNLDYGRQIDCLTIIPTINGTKLDPGNEFTYITTIRNNCSFKLDNAVLRVVLPQETNFVSTPFPAYSTEGNTVIFNLGNVDIGAQIALNILGKIKTNTRNGDHLVFSSILTFNYKNYPNTLTTYLTAVVGQEVSGGGFAAAIKALGGIFTNFIFWLILVLAMGFWIIYLLITRKREQETKYDLSGLKVTKEGQ